MAHHSLASWPSKKTDNNFLSKLLNPLSLSSARTFSYQLVESANQKKRFINTQKNFISKTEGLNSERRKKQSFYDSFKYFVYTL